MVMRKSGTSKRATKKRSAKKEPVEAAPVEKEIVEAAPAKAAQPYADWDAPLVSPELPLAPPIPEVKAVTTAEVPEVQAEVSEVQAEVPGFVTVVAIRADQYEPFERVKLAQGRPTSVRDTDWIRAQLRAGILRLT